MLPGIRAVLGAIVAAIGLMTISFGLVAAFRVAQDTRIGLMQADIAQRGRISALAAHEPTAVVMADKPAPLQPNPVAPVEIAQELDIIRDAPQAVAQERENPTILASAPVEIEPQDTAQSVAEPPTTAPAAIPSPATELAQTEQPAEITTIEQLIAELAAPEPPMGGPLAEQKKQKEQKTQKVTQKKPKAAQERAKKKKEAQAAAQKQRAQRLARERKAAARKARAAQIRAARARAKQQAAGSFDNAPAANSFGTYNTAPFGGGTFGSGATGTFGSTGTFGNSASGR